MLVQYCGKSSRLTVTAEVSQEGVDSQDLLPGQLQVKRAQWPAHTAAMAPASVRCYCAFRPEIWYALLDSDSDIQVTTSATVQQAELQDCTTCLLERSHPKVSRGALFSELVRY